MIYYCHSAKKSLIIKSYLYNLVLHLYQNVNREKYYEIAETAEKIYIGTDFPDEFVHGKDKTVLKGPNLKAKANAAQAEAAFSWYRYDTRLALPVYNHIGEIERYNIYKSRMLVRHDEDGKLYLYDFLRTKKETRSPLK